MKASVVAGSLLSGLMLIAGSMQAQQVSADVVLHGGPVAGRVVVGDGYSTYHRPVVYRRPPVRRVVVVERPLARVVVVDRMDRHRPAAFWRRHGFRPVTLYYVDGRYFDRPIRRAHVREVLVYERDGRYYEDCDHADSHGRGHGHREHHWDD